MLSRLPGQLAPSQGTWVSLTLLRTDLQLPQKSPIETTWKATEANYRGPAWGFWASEEHLLPAFVLYLSDYGSIYILSVIDGKAWLL